jgi:hypothetical protein
MKYYVLQDVDGALIGFDYASGGYPWQAWKPERGDKLHGVAMYPFTAAGKKKALDDSGRDKFELAILEFTITKA